LLVYSPGINCLDADAITVHIVFHEFYARIRGELSFSCTGQQVACYASPEMYYKLIMALERRIYTTLKSVWQLSRNLYPHNLKNTLDELILSLFPTPSTPWFLTPRLAFSAGQFRAKA